MAENKILQPKIEQTKPQLKLGELDLPTIFNANNLEFQGFTETGDFAVKDKDTGKEGSLARSIVDQQARSQLGVGLDRLDVIYNSPDTALPVVPMSFQNEEGITKRRDLIGRGNDKGRLSYLSKEFGDGNVKLTEKNGLVIKDKDGVWKTLDPDSGISEWIKDPWEFSRDIADLEDVGRSALYTIAGSQVGRVVGGVIGAATGAATTGFAGIAPGFAGGQVAGQLIGSGAGGYLSAKQRTSLGRAVGTYEATPEEQMFDIGMETFLSVGGEGVNLGFKPTMTQLGRAAKYIGTKIPEGVKDTLATTVGTLTKAGSDTFHRIFNDPKGWATKLNFLKKEAMGNTDNMMLKAAEKRNESLQPFLERGIKRLPEKYGELLDDIGKKAGGKNIVIDPHQVITDISNELTRQGIGRLELQTSKNGAKRWMLSALSPEEQQIFRQTTGAGAAKIEPGVISALNESLSLLDEFTKSQKLRGKQATGALVDINKVSNNLTTKLRGVGSAAFGDRPLAIFNDVTDTVIKKQFKDIGLESEYIAANKMYTKYANAIQQTRNLVDQQAGSGFVDKYQGVTDALFNNTSKKLKTNQTVNLLLELTGNAGKRDFEEAMMWEAARRTSPIGPKIGTLQTGIFTSSAAAAAAGAGTPAGVGVLATGIGSMPRSMAASTAVAGRAAQTAKNVVKGVSGFLASDTPQARMSNFVIDMSLSAGEMLKSLSPAAMSQLRNNPTLMKSFTEMLDKNVQDKQELDAQIQNAALQGNQ